MEHKKKFYIEILRARARKLRKSPTRGEKAFWEMVRRRKFHRHRFRRQVVLVPYIVDFYCRDLKLIVEIDGGCHRDRRGADIRRDAALRGRGFTVLRFTNEEILENPARVWKVLHCWRKGALGEDST